MLSVSVWQFVKVQVRSIGKVGLASADELAVRSTTDAVQREAAREQ